MFTALILLGCAIASFYSYHMELGAQVSDTTSQSLMLLGSMSTSIRARATHVEIIVQELVARGRIVALLHAESIESQIVRLEFGVKPQMLDARAYLAEFSPDMLILAHRDNLLVSRDYIVDGARMAEDGFYADFFAGPSLSAWACAEQAISPARAGEMQVAYFYKVLTGARDCRGVVRCAIAQEVMFGALANWTGERALFVMDEAAALYRCGAPEILPPASSGGASWREGGTLYVAADIEDMNVKLVLAMDYGAIQASVLRNVLHSLAVIILSGVALLCGTRLLLGRLLSRLQRLTQAVRSMPAQNYDVQLSESGPDEVGQLATAFNHLLCQVNDSYDQLLSKERDKRRAMTLALQYQINPHFLFNALYCLQLKAEELGMSGALCESISQLGTVLHYNLDSAQLALLSEEETQMQAYISFLRTVKDCPISLDMTIPPEMSDYRILRFSLQPILENSVQHGLTSGQTLRIRVDFRADAQKNLFAVSVENDGRVIPDGELQALRARMANAKEIAGRAKGRGLGLVNLMRRLELTYGVSARINITSQPGCTRFEILLPLDRCAGETEGERT